MKLRTKLALGFLAVSVLPLAAVTAYSYRNSVQAFRRAVESEAGATASEMGHRVEVVRTALAHEFGRLGGHELALGSGEDTRESWSEVGPRLRQQLARELGHQAAFFNRMEFVPGVPRAPGNAAEIPSPPVSIDVQDLLKQVDQLSLGRAEIDRAEHEARDRGASDEVRQQLQRARESLQRNLRTATEQLVARQRALAGAPPAPPAAMPAAPEPPEPPAAAAAPAPAGDGTPPAPLRVPVMRDGHVVGEVRAEVDLGRVLEGALALPGAPPDEIPFAITRDGRFLTGEPQHAEQLAPLHIPERVKESETFAVAGPDGGEWVVVTRADAASGAVFGIARPVGQNFTAFRRAAALNLALGLGAIGLAFVVLLPLSARLTRHVSTLIDGTRRLADGHLETRVPVQSSDEIGELARAFNAMAAELGEQQQRLVQQERLQRELELCRQIQAEMLPKRPLQLGALEVKGVSIPAREVGGDFFNYFVLDSGQVALLVGDVSGKGVGAALLMAKAQAELAARLATGDDLAQLAASLDREIDRSTPPEVYLTLFVSVFDPGTRALHYVSAGHNTQYVVRRAGGTLPLPSTGMPLGLFAGRPFAVGEHVLEPGDLLFFYTDGVTEAVNREGEMFGTERLESLLRAAPRGGAEELLAAVEASVAAFRAGAEAPDDATMMVLRLA